MDDLEYVESRSDLGGSDEDDDAYDNDVEENFHENDDHDDVDVASASQWHCSY